MPTIPAMVLPGTTLKIDEVYFDSTGSQPGLFKPQATPTTGEILNGGLDSANWSGGTGTINIEHAHEGAFARGWYLGFDEIAYVYARQLSGDGATAGATASKQSQRIPFPNLNLRLFLPWTASVFLYGFQAFERHDATHWERGANPDHFEYFELQTKFNSAVKQASYVKLPHTRVSTGDPSGGGYVDPGLSDEQKWKWLHKPNMKLNLAKGYQSLTISAWGRIFPNDNKRAKIAVPNGGIWMFAIR